MHRLTFALLLTVLACGDDMIVDPSTSNTTESTTEAATTDSTTTPTTPTSGGPFPGPTSDPPTTTEDPTATGTTTEDPTAPALCDAAEPVAEADFPSAMATRVCQRRGMCGCAGATCTIDVAAALSDMATWSKGQMLTYDPDCAATLFARAEAIACDDQITAIEEGCTSCNIYRGARPVDQACDTNAYSLYASQCAAGLACSPGTDVCTTTDFPVVGLGDPCFIAMTTVARCPDDALCDSAGTGACVPAPGPGEPCFAGTRCAAGQWCDGDGLCRLQKAEGAPCTSLIECHSLECTDNVCASTPWICRLQWSAGA